MIIICGLKVINNIYVIYILYILKKSNAKHKKFVWLTWKARIFQPL